MYHSRLKKFLIGVAVVILILVIGYFGINAYSRSLVKTEPLANNKANSTPYLVDNTRLDTYKEELSQQPSDIEGMTKLDKYNIGLSVKDGSDTDGDGLTDKEEIETYKSDPHKKSTAGDLYSDGYKAKNGMDIHKKYDRNPSEVEYPNIATKDIAVKAATTDGANVRIMNVTGVYEDLAVPAEDYYKWASEYTIYRDYEVSGFDGELTVDVSGILTEKKDEGLEPKHLRILVSTDPGFQKLSEVSYKMDGNKLTPDIASANTSGYFLMVIARKSLTGHIVSDVKNSKAVKALAGSFAKNESPLDASGDALLSNRFGILGSFRIVHPVIYYVPYADEDLTNQMLDGMVSMGNQCTDATDFVTRSDCKQVTRDELAAKRELYKKFFPDCEVFYDGDYHVKSSAATFKQMVVFSYINYNEELANIDGRGTFEIPETSSPENSTLTAPQTSGIPKDFLGNETFAFRNFGSAVANGNCEGISLFAVTLHNRGEVPSEGTFEFNKITESKTGVKELSWNIAKDEDNKTLLDRGLSDFKDKDWTDRHALNDRGKLDYNTLSDSEKEFVNMIGCYWGLGNKMFPTDGEFAYNYGESYVTTDTIYNIIDQLNHGRVVKWGAPLYDGGKRKDDGVTLTEMIGYHTMVIYDYSYKRKNCISVNGDVEMCNVFYFKVYDCNYPQNDTTNILTMIEAPGGNVASYRYDPDPTHGGPVVASHKFTSDLQSTGYFEISDEDFNGYTVFGAFETEDSKAAGE